MAATRKSLAEVMAQVASELKEKSDGAVPRLATPEQIYAERMTLRILEQPKLKATLDEILRDLRSHPNSQSKDGAATLEKAVGLLSRTFTTQRVGWHILPALLINNDDSSHTWFGHTFPGVGVSGDNPDNTIRSVFLDGTHRYEIQGELPEAGQITLALSTAVGGNRQTSSKTTDIGNQIGLLMNESLQIRPDRSFTVTIDQNEGGANHLRGQPEMLRLMVRQSRSDWRQPAARMTIRRTDGEGPLEPVFEDLVDDVAAGIREYCFHWADFRMTYLGRPPVNTITPPLGRVGSWGYLAGGRWEIGPDEAIVAVTRPQGANYTGLMLTDPWAMALDAWTTFSSRNNAQTTLDADGSATYVISHSDPGAPNWLGTEGLSQGEIRLRWQEFPSAFDPDKAVASYRKVRLADLAQEAPGHAGVVSPEARRAELERRVSDYALRWTT